MITIGLDLSQVTALSNVRRGQFNRIAQQIVEEATHSVHDQIHREANRSLKSTRQIYKRNINRPEIGRLRGSITLTGQLPNMIEQGASPFDMKDGFRKSRKAKRKKDGGWYLTIPFRHASAGAIGESQAFSSVMPREVYRAARQLKSTITAPFIGKIRTGNVMQPHTLKRVGHGVLGKREAIPQSAGGDLTGSQRAAYTHRAPKYAGLTRQKKFYQLFSQGSYVTFRRVSDRSPDNSWIHKGIKKYNLMGKAAESVDYKAIMIKVTRRELQAMGL